MLCRLLSRSSCVPWLDRLIQLPQTFLSAYVYFAAGSKRPTVDLLRNGRVIRIVNHVYSRVINCYTRTLSFTSICTSLLTSAEYLSAMTASEGREDFIKSDSLTPCLYLQHPQHPQHTLRWSLPSRTKLPSPLTLSMKATISSFHLSFLNHHDLALYLLQSRIILWVVGEHGPLVGPLLLPVECGVLTLPPHSNWSMDDLIMLCGYGKHTFIFHNKLGSHYLPP